MAFTYWNHCICVEPTILSMLIKDDFMFQFTEISWMLVL